MDYRKLLHGEQGFSYHGMAYAGDKLTFEQRIEDILRQKGRACSNLWCARPESPTSAASTLPSCAPSPCCATAEVDRHDTPKQNLAGI
jgi:hypothetical protein